MTLRPADGLGEQFLLLDSCFQASVAVAFPQELQYFTELVFLFADLCLGRNFTCSNEIRNRFTISTLLHHIWNPQLSIDLRAAFTRLLQTLYIDSYPREEVKKPELCRPLGQLDSSVMNLRREVQRRHSLKMFGHKPTFRRGARDALSRQSSIMDSALLLPNLDPPDEHEAFEVLITSEEEILFQLKEDILAFLQNNSENPSELHVDLLHLALQMARFELFGASCSFLESRKCVVDPQHRLFSEDACDLVRLARAVKPLLGPIPDLKTPMSERRSQSIYNTVLAQVLKNPASMADSIVRASVATKNLLNSYNLENKEMTELDLAVKREVFDLLHYMLDFRQDCLVNKALEHFARGDESTPEAEKIFPPVMLCKKRKKSLIAKKHKHKFECIAKVLINDLDELLKSGGTLTTELLHYLVASSDFMLQTKLIHLLSRCFSQRAEMLETLERIYVVSAPDDVRVFHWLKLLLPRLRQQTEQSEIWLKHEQQSGALRKESEDTAEAVTRALKQLRDLLLVGSDVHQGEPQGQQGRVSVVRQTMMYHLNVHSVIVNLLRDGLSALEEATNSVEPNAIIELFSCCHIFLRRFVENNQCNQAALYEHLHLFKACLRIDVQQMPLICAIYQDNMDLCLQVTADSLQVFVQAIKDVGRQPRLLKIFSTIQVVNGIAIPANQSLTLKLLMSAHRDYVLYLDPTDPREFLFECEPGKEDEPFFYHAELLSVLARCGWGSEQVYLNEVKLQKFLSMEKLFTLLQRSEDTTQPHAAQLSMLRLPLLEFLYHIYLETQKWTEELVGNQLFLDFVKKQTHQLYALEFVTDAYLEYFELLLRILVMYTHSYLSHGEEEMFQDQESLKVLKKFAVAVERNSKKFQGVHLPESLHHRTTEFLALFSIHSEANWQLTHQSTAGTAPPEDADLQRWRSFQSSLAHNQSLQQAATEEWQYFLRLLMKADRLSPQLTFAHIIRKYIGYLNLAPFNQPPLQVFREVVETLRGCIKSVEKGHRENSDEALKRIQDELASYNICSEVLNIMCFHEYYAEHFRLVTLLAIDLLQGGNRRTQDEFYLYFVNVPASELFFQRVFNLLQNECEILISNDTRPPSDLLSPLLRLLQLLCEGHNSNLQKLLCQQTHARRSYDLVTQCVNLMAVLMTRLRASDFEQTSQCFDTLIEFVQGPCTLNQNCIIEGSFLESAVVLLSLDEHASSLRQYDELDTQSKPRANSHPFTGHMISQLKMKCMIALHSLLEGNEDPYILTLLMRALNLELLQANIKNFFIHFHKKHPPNAYDEDMFGQADEESEEVEILETPFLIFHLIKKFYDLSDNEQRQRIQEELPTLTSPASSSFAGRLINNFGKLGLGLLKEGKARMKQLSQSFTKRVHPEVLAKQEKDEVKDMYEYLEAHTGCIEVIVNKAPVRVYFPLPAYSEVLSLEMKDNFHYYADRSSHKAKLVYLQDQARDLNLQLMCEYRLQKFLSLHASVAFIAKNVGLWRDLGTLLTLVLNFLILTSFSAYGSDRLDAPSVFYYEGGESNYGVSATGTESLFIVLGVLQIICTFFVVLSFLSKTSPLLAYHGWTKVHRPTIPPTQLKAAWLVYKRLFWVLVYVFSDGWVLYYIACIVLSILGVTTSPLFFSFHLTELILRYPSLQIVVQAVIRPWRRTLLTYCLLLVFVYYFGIVGYAYFEHFFKENDNSLLITVITVFDASFKNNGGIGGYLPDWSTGTLDVGRLIYDDLGNIILMIIMLNIWAGITKDAFTALREQHEEDQIDREKYCFICGLDKETIERTTKRPFQSHQTYDHSEWNYLFFLGYLRAKDSTEFTGVESYVWDQYQRKDIAWLPQAVGNEMKNDDSDDYELAELRTRVNRRLKQISEKISVLRSWVKVEKLEL